MNDTTSSPSRLLKITAVTARWLLGLVAAAWLLFALSVAVLHGWIVPRIGDYRGALEAQAGRAIGVPVRIGGISAESDGIFPTFHLRDVVLLDPSGREALRLEAVVASVSPRSIWRLGFEQIHLRGPTLEVRLDGRGKLHVAGLDLSANTGTDTGGSDWFFSQREVVIEGGTVRWIDERRRVEPLMLTDVRFVARNGGRRHALRVDATPPEGWGERFSLRGQFRHPLLTLHRGDWRRWNGTVYAELPRADVSRLGRYVTLGAQLREGNGAVRVWADVIEGRFVGGAADLALASVDVALGEALQPLVLSQVRGRIAGSHLADTLEFATTDLRFDKPDGTHWPGGNLWFRHSARSGRTPERTAIRADRLDLDALAQIASRLPLGAKLHAALGTYAPRGLVERIDAKWEGDADAPSVYSASGRVRDLSIASQPAPVPAAPSDSKAPDPAQGGSTAAPPAVGTPGLRGATLDFEATQAGGRAGVQIERGHLDLPGVFEEPVVPIDRLAAQARWQIDGSALRVQLDNLRFANADAQGEAQIDWRTSDPAVSPSRDRHPGVLDLRGQLTRADGTRVFRYLPLVIPKATRDYVRDSVRKGTASSVDFRVRGDLHDMPFTDPKRGDFRIAAKVAGVDYDYVPASLVAAGKAAVPVLPAPVPASASTTRRSGSGLAASANAVAGAKGAQSGGVAGPAWPGLTGLSGELVFERAGMLVRNAKGRLVGAPGVEVTQAEARIPDMGHHAPLLQVEARARGPLDEMLHAAVPLVGDAGAALARVRATGPADYRLKLELPIEAVEQAKVQVGVVLGGNELQLVPEAPSFT
ncbi:MAG: TIGR02099 family protein, partial [Comamonadaceae bacterium]